MLRSLIALLFVAQPALAQTQTVSLGQTIDESQNIGADIAYASFVPQFEEVQDPAKSVRIEVYFAEDDHSEQSKKRLQWMRAQIQRELKDHPEIATQFEATGKAGDSPEGNADVAQFFSDLGLSRRPISYSLIPDDVNLEVANHAGITTGATRSKTLARKPAATIGRSFWSVIRFTSSLGASFLGLNYGFHVAPETALLTSLVPALGSAGICYFSSSYGRFLVSKNWSKAVVEGSNPFARTLQKLMKIDPASMALKTASEKAAVIAKLHSGEEVVRWYLTELIFTAGLIKLPQRIASITHEGLVSASLSGVKSSVLGFLAQGPGDVAVTKRKVQKFEELRAGLESGQIVSPDKDRIIQELNEILSPVNPRNVDGSVHPMIQKIENWARSRGVLMSFICVSGVVLDTVGVKLSSYLLIGLGASGAYYYAQVNGWFAPEGQVSQAYQATREKLERFGSKLVSLTQRICGNDTSDNSEY